MSEELKNKDFIVKHLKDTMAKVQGAKYLLNNGKIPIVYNKLIGIYQKLGFLIREIEKDNESN